MAYNRASFGGADRRSEAIECRSPALYTCAVSAAIRTQVYLTEDQRRRIDDIAKAEDITLAEVVRRALDSYLNAERDVAVTLAATFGADPDARAPTRAEWDRA